MTLSVNRGGPQTRFVACDPVTGWLLRDGDDREIVVTADSVEAAMEAFRALTKQRFVLGICR